ncbi:TetR family transcriptional regulator [Lentzea sp. NBRC 105346]|uniref:TetR/AcrR family transcriptional regulator n=1 Tax=Lentzea sp. NBRC 105346 TaxID=3032205 RepID=UPI0024A4B1A9|nr:TetR/AcrR family transcriptional regulator [Lentzea sp. NBRC 105346]GLZ32797.1 TetR family transcriptional regulator [Lentzea sp. NBRC 105346]
MVVQSNGLGKVVFIVGIKGQVQQRGVERRREIVDAAIELFGRNGYAGTGVAAIAKIAGVTPSAVIHHFGSKENLLKAVLDEFDARAAARVGSRSLREALLEDAEYTMAHKGLATLHTVLQAEHIATDSAVRDRFRARNRLLRGHFAAELGDAGATELIAFLEGALTVWLLDPETTDLRAMYEHYLSSRHIGDTGPTPPPSG